MEPVTPYYRSMPEDASIEYRKIEETGFTSKDIKRTRKKLKKAGVPKEHWYVDILNKETNGIIRFKL